MNTDYLIQVIDLRFLVDRNKCNKIQIFEDDRGATSKTKLLIILIRYKEIKMISEAIKISEIVII